MITNVLRSKLMSLLIMVSILVIVLLVDRQDQNPYWMSISIVSLVGGMTTLIVTKLRVRRNHQQLMYFIIRFVLLGIVFTSNQHPSSNYHYIRFFVTGCIVQNTLDKKLKFQNPAIQMAEKTVMLMFTVFYTIYWQNNQLTQAGIFGTLAVFLVLFLSQCLRYQKETLSPAPQKPVNDDIQSFKNDVQDPLVEIKSVSSRQQKMYEIQNQQQEIFLSRNIQINVDHINKSNMINQKVNFIPSLAEPMYYLRRHLYEQVIQQLSDGVAVIDHNKRIQFVSLGLRRMMTCSGKKETVEKLLGMENCGQTMKEQGTFNKVFLSLTKRISSKEPPTIMKQQSGKSLQDMQSEVEKSMRNSYVYQADEDDEDDVEEELNRVYEEYQSCFSDMATVKAQLDDVVANMMQQVEQHPEQFQQHHQFKQGKEIKMICKFTERESQAVLRDQQSMVNESRSHTTSTKQLRKRCLFQVTFKVFIAEGNGFVLVTARDVTMFNHIELLKSINSNKSRMLSQVAHEFRTPLGCIILFLKSLTTSISPDLSSKFAEPSISLAQTLLSLVNDLLDVAQLKAGSFKLNFVDFDLYKHLTDIVEVMDIQSSARNISLELRIAHGTQQYINSDPNRIRQIMINLVGNSIKFCANGTIVIRVRNLTDQYIEISVIDDGVGISKENMSRLFKSFGKLPDADHINDQGVGLGLMISNILATRLSLNPQLQNFDTSNEAGLQVFSEGEGKGTTFSFIVYDCGEGQIFNESEIKKINTQSSKLGVHRDPSIDYNSRRSLDIGHMELYYQQQAHFGQPLMKIYKENSDGIRGLSDVDIQKPVSQQTPLRQNGHSPSRLGKKKCVCNEILIVDDSQFNLAALSSHLDRNKFRTDTALSGFEAIKRVENFTTCDADCIVNYKVILMDIDMPGISGIETTKRLLSIFSNRGINCVIWGLSGYQSEEERKKCLQAGMTKYFVKPPNIEQLVEQLRDEIEISKKFEHVD